MHIRKLLPLIQASKLPRDRVVACQKLVEELLDHKLSHKVGCIHKYVDTESRNFQDLVDICNIEELTRTDPRYEQRQQHCDEQRERLDIHDLKQRLRALREHARSIEKQLDRLPLDARKI